MADIFYTEPDLPASAHVDNLVPADVRGQRLAPETVVLAFHRGGPAVRDKFDGRSYVIRPGYFRETYGMVLHFKSRAVVPGSRNPETGKQESFLCIPGVDSPEDCLAFTPQQIEQYGLKVEAIDRESLSSAEGRSAAAVPTNAARARMPGAGAGPSHRPVFDGSVQATPGAAAVVESVGRPLDPSENEALQEQAEGSREQAGRAADVAQADATRRRQGRQG